MMLTTMKTECRYLIIWLVLGSGCAGFDSSGMQRQDTAEEVRMKAVLLEAEDLAGSAINITIREGQTLLEGFVETAEQRQRAEDLVRQGSNGDNVRNRIRIK
jgi:osmotically-inducible protein OsmY